MSYLELNKLEKRYSSKGDLVVKGVDLAIEKGEFIVLLGPSGCGKTTVLRMISGLEDTSGGDITLEGRSIVKLAPRDRGISMIFQSYAVWPHMTVYENIAYSLKLKKKSRDEIHQAVMEAAEICDITSYLKRYPAQLSGGQRQRVAVARALAVKPKIFLMDEPLSNLDAKLRVSMRTELKNIHQTCGATSIFVTHDQSEAMSLADRIVVMRNGFIEQIGTPQEVYHDSESIFVASFIGTPPTNFFRVTVRRREGVICAAGKNFALELSSQDQKRLEPYLDKEVVLGVRPETFVLSREEVPGMLTRVPIEIVEPQGSHTILFTHLDGIGTKIMTTLEQDVRPGDLFYLGVSEGSSLFFDPETEKRIR